MSARLKHVGFHPERLRMDDSLSSREKAFAQEWAELNRIDLPRNPCLLRVLLAAPRDPGSPVPVAAMLELTQQHASIAATLMQWLGTNIGWAFLEAALRRSGYAIVRIDESKAGRT